MENYSLYLHLPFCLQRCAYCDFNSTSGRLRDIPAYTSALINEIRAVGDCAPHPIPVHTIYFGGGTPALLGEAPLNTILTALRQTFHILLDAEITLEANPGGVSLQNLKSFHQMGINRLSMGIQSIHADELHLLGRVHNHEQSRQAVAWAKAAGFTNLNLDAIFGLPGQSMARWQETLQELVRLEPQHISLYALTLEEGTPLEQAVASGRLPEPDDDLAADMYEWTEIFLKQNGFIHYEISNWALNSTAFASHHNMQYWLCQPYLGFGAGAHGYAAGLRTENIENLDAYLHVCQAEVKPQTTFPCGPATAHTEVISDMESMREWMMLGLRLTDAGVSSNAFFNRYHRPMHQVFGAEIEELTQKGLLESISGTDRLRLTARGRLLGNQVFMQFVTD